MEPSQEQIDVRPPHEPVGETAFDPYAVMAEIDELLRDNDEMAEEIRQLHEYLSVAYERIRHLEDITGDKYEPENNNY